MSLLFESGRIANMTVKNRFVRTAQGDGWPTLKGECTDETVNFYSQLADGGTGLLTTGASDILEKYKVGRFVGMYSDELIDGYKKLTRAVHDYDAKIVCQLHINGRANFGDAFGPSPVPVDPAGGGSPVRIHSFLSPHDNLRKDKWGGSFDNNMRFLLECYEQSRKAVGDDYPIMIKVSVQDYIEGGITLDLGLRYAEKISEVGFNAIETSAGVNTDRPYFYMAKGDLPANACIFGKSKEQTREAFKNVKGFEDDIKFEEAYFRPFAKEVKKVVKIPVVLPGGNRTVSNMEDILKSGDADFIGLCRPLIREPDFPNKVKKWGQKKAECLNCNRCLTTGPGPFGPTPCYQKMFRPARMHL